jgi:hypothetical protein
MEKEYALSNQDINDLLKQDTHIWTYPELASVSHIDDCLDSLGRMILLYPLENENSGHWVALWRKGKKLFYFDSYGKGVEEPKQWISQEKNEMMGQGQDHLTRLLRESGYEVYQNKYPYQPMDGSSATCGRWAVSRLICKDMDAKRFHATVQKFKKGSTDDFAVQMTAHILGK